MKTPISFLTVCISVLLLLNTAQAQESSFLILGDIHYDLIENHDMEWLATKPDDLRQVTQGYTRYTQENWIDFCKILKRQCDQLKPEVKAVIQLGDISEGLAGNPKKAIQMAKSTMRAIEKTDIDIPWIIAKGNHDITGPGAVEAFNDIYIPAFRKFTNNPEIKTANYGTTINNIFFACFDPWEKRENSLDILEKNLSSSKAKYKFVLLHEPVIPVNERCWHVYRKKPDNRNRLLKIIAENNAIILCAHLHHYSIVKRNTEWGPIVQILTNSVIRNRKHLTPKKIYTEYGSVLAKEKPDWQPNTLEDRIKWLDEETPHVSYFKQMDLPGYGILSIDPQKDSIILQYYAAFADIPYDTVDISALLK